MKISDIKNQLSILVVLRHYNLSPDRNNRLKCPFHDDKTPSFQVYPKTGTWTCFSGNCDAGSGDQIEFIMKHERISKHDAIVKAKEMLGHNNKPVSALRQTPALAELTREQHQQILTESFTHFVRSLGAKPKKAMEYLESRKLDHKLLSVGFDAGTLHKRREITEGQK